MSKKIAIFVVLILLVSLFTGCAPSETGPTDATGTPETTGKVDPVETGEEPPSGGC